MKLRSALATGLFVIVASGLSGSPPDSPAEPGSSEELQTLARRARYPGEGTAIVSDESFRVLDWNAPRGETPAFRMRQLRLRVQPAGDAARAFQRDLTLLETPEGRRWAVEHVTLPPGPVRGDQPFERVASSEGGRAELRYVPDARQPFQVADPVLASRSASAASRDCAGAWLRLSGAGKSLLLDGGELAGRSVIRLIGSLRAAAFRPQEVEDLYRLVRMERYPESAGTGESFVLPRLLLRDRLPMPADARSLYREEDTGTPLPLDAFRALADLPAALAGPGGAG